MRRTTFLTATVALLLAGCGASMTELVAEERWYDACDGFDRDDPQHAAKSDYLVGELAAGAECDLRTHVATPEELGELLPHVPARMASGEVVLVATDAHYRSGEFSFLRADARPVAGEAAGRPYSCCEPGEWMDLDGRAEEWERHREAYERARSEARRRRERYSGRFGGLRMLGDMFAGGAADLALIGSLGIIDIDVSDLPLARISGLQAMRAIGRRVAESVRRRGSTSGTGADAALATRRAESLAILSHLLTDPPLCYVDRPEDDCRSVALYEMPQGQRVDAVETRLYAMVEDPDGDSCDIASTARSPIDAARAGQPLGGVFQRTSPPAY